MAEARQTAGWTRFFRKSALEGEDFLGKFLSGIARIFEGGDQDETLRQIRAELIKVFECEEVSLFAYNPEEAPSLHEGAWALTCRVGFGQGNRVSQMDGQELSDLQPGKPIVFSEPLAEKAALKAIALAFEEEAFYGCDIEKGKIVLLKNPTPEDDLGSGDLSVLAIPLHYTNRVGRITEKVRVGVLALYRTPIRREMGELEVSLRSLLAYALITPTISLKDPISGLFTETYLLEELRRQMALFDLTKGKLRGGFVIGMIDTLKLYRQTLESTGKVDPREVSEKVSDVLRGVGACVRRRAQEHTLGVGEEYRGGFAGRIGTDGFGVILPLLQGHEMCMWSVRLAKDVIDHHFEAEELLMAGDITVSLRVIPFARGTPEELLKLANKVILDLEAEQLRARRDPEALAKSLNTIRVFHRGKWVTTSEFSSSAPRR